MAYLKECVESVRIQRGPDVDVEHIFVDGGSTDGTAEYAAAGGCTVLTRDEYNLTFAINKGIRHASGTLVTILGCDDVLLPGAIESVARAYLKDGRRWLIGNGEWIDATGRSRGVQKPPPARFGTRAIATLGWGPFMPAATFIERDFVKELGYFDVDYYYAADYDLFLRALSRAPYSRVRCQVAGIRRDGGNTSMERNPQHEFEIRKIAETYGPRRASVRAGSKLGLKVWINGTSPGWFVRKHMDARRPPQSH